MRLMILGAGGHGKVCMDIAEEMGIFDEILFLDDAKCGETVFNHEVVEEIEKYFLYIEEDTGFFVAIGDNEGRKKIIEEVKRNGGKIVNLIHPSSMISRYAQIGDGNIIMANSIVNAGAVLGNGIIINTGAVVEHDCHIENYVHCSPLSVVCGTCHIKEGAWIGAGATVIQGKIVGKRSRIGAGSVVIEDVKDWTTVIGVPAKERGNRDE